MRHEPIVPGEGIKLARDPRHVLFYARLPIKTHTHLRWSARKPADRVLAICGSPNRYQTGIAEQGWRKFRKMIRNIKIVDLTYSRSGGNLEFVFVLHARTTNHHSNTINCGSSMTTFEKESTGTTYDDRDKHQQWDSHQQGAGLATAGNVMSAWTVASYDYAEQVLKAQRQFFHSMLAAAAPMVDVARDITSPDATEDRSAKNQLDVRSNQRHDDSNRSRKNERYNDDDTQAEESAKTRAPVAASAPDRKRP